MQWRNYYCHNLKLIHLFVRQQLLLKENLTSKPPVWEASYFSDAMFTQWVAAFTAHVWHQKVSPSNEYTNRLFLHFYELQKTFMNFYNRGFLSFWNITFQFNLKRPLFCTTLFGRLSFVLFVSHGRPAGFFTNGTGWRTQPDQLGARTLTIIKLFLSELTWRHPRAYMAFSIICCQMRA